MIIYLLICLLIIISFKYCLLFLICNYMLKRSRKGVVSTIYENDVNNSIQKTINNCLSGFVILSLSQLGRFPSNMLRVWTLKHIYCMDIADRVSIHSNFTIRHPWNIHIGAGSVIGDFVYLDGRKGIFIGENVNISTGVCIWTMQHDLNDPFFGCSDDKIGKVTIDNRAWLSCRTIILPKVYIGEGSVIAAGAVVSHDCDSFSVNGGIPAKRIGQRNTNLHYEFKPQDGLWFV